MAINERRLVLMRPGNVGLKLCLEDLDVGTWFTCGNKIGVFYKYTDEVDEHGGISCIKFCEPVSEYDDIVTVEELKATDDCTIIDPRISVTINY